MHVVLTRLAALLAAACFWAAASAQGLAFSPANPNDTDWITIRFLGGSSVGAPDNPLCAYANAAYRKVSVSNNVLRIELFDENPAVWPGGTPPTPVGAHDVWAGRLVAGSYRVELHCTDPRGQSFQYASGTLSVASSYMTRAERRNPAAYPPHPLINYSGHWTPADELGWGLIIQQVDGRQVAVTLFTYGADTRPVWYFCGGGRWETAFTYRSSCERFQANGFGTSTGNLAVTGTGSVYLRFALNSTGVPGDEQVGFSPPENSLVADIVAEGRAISSKRFVRIR